LKSGGAKKPACNANSAKALPEGNRQLPASSHSIGIPDTGIPDIGIPDIGITGSEIPDIASLPAIRRLVELSRFNLVLMPLY
jgi:hypothetical protein